MPRARIIDEARITFSGDRQANYPSDVVLRFDDGSTIAAEAIRDTTSKTGPFREFAAVFHPRANVNLTIAVTLRTDGGEL